MPLSENVRRVVTAIDKNDKAVVLMDSPIPHKKVRPQAQTVSRLIWVTDQTPADLSGTSDRAAIDIGIMPPRGGSVFRIVEFSPDPAWRKNGKKGTPPSDPIMHATKSLDYIIVLKGEIYVILDEGEKLLKQGDVLIQRGTNHSWSVRSRKPCIVAGIVVDAAKPARAQARKRR